jgi:hypothetical protein
VRILPKKEAWDTYAFQQSKAAIKARYGLSNRQFSLALDCIQENREMSAILGVESPPLHITDEEVIWAVEQWRRLHPAHEPDQEGKASHFWITSFEQIVDDLDQALEIEVIDNIKRRLSLESLSDLESMYYLGITGNFSENYEKMLDRSLKEYHVVKNPTEKITHLISKGTFLKCIRRTSFKLGRISLCDRLKTM